MIGFWHRYPKAIRWKRIGFDVNPILKPTLAYRRPKGNYLGKHSQIRPDFTRQKTNPAIT